MDRPTDQPSASPPPAPPPSSVRPPLRRPREDRILAGVGAGLSDHLGIDVVLVRILIVVLAVLTNGVFVLAYIAAAIFIPAAEPGAPRPEPRRGARADGERDPLFWVGVGALVVGALWLTGGATGGLLFGGGGFGRLVVPLILIAFGLALWRAGDRREIAPDSYVPGPPSYPAAAYPGPAPAAPGSPGPTSPVPASRAPGQPPSASSATPPPPSSTSPLGLDPTVSTEPPMNDTTTDPTIETATHPSTAAGTADARPPADGAGGAPPMPPDAGQPHGEPAWTPPPVPEPRERSLLTRLTLGTALVVLGVLWSLRVADVLDIGWGTILAGSLLVIGLGLLIGSVVGRARWLILVGALLAPVVLLAQLAPLPYLADGWTGSNNAGEIRATPDDLDALRTEYRLGAGSIRLDLTELDLDGEDVSVSIGLGAGEIRVLVPDDVEVAATATTGIGQIRLFDVRAAGGVGPGEQQATSIPEGESRGRIELRMEMGLGEIRVESVPVGADASDPSDEPGPGLDAPDDGGSGPGTDLEPGPEPDAEPAPEPEPAAAGA